MTHFSFGELRFYRRPGFALRSITQEIHYDRALRDRLIDLKQIRPRNPSIILSFPPWCTVLTNTYNDVEAIIAQVKALTMSLRAVPNESKRIIFKIILVI